MQTAKVARQIYETSVKNLPAVERLQLVKLVMDDLMNDPTTWIVDENEARSEEDYANLARASLLSEHKTLRFLNKEW
jgi:hypothetical protein